MDSEVLNEQYSNSKPASLIEEDTGEKRTDEGVVDNTATITNTTGDITGIRPVTKRKKSERDC